MRQYAHNMIWESKKSSAKNINLAKKKLKKESFSDVVSRLKCCFTFQMWPKTNMSGIDAAIPRNARHLAARG